MEKAKIKVAVHNGEFHPDDVMCVVMLADKFGLGNLEIIRTRDAEVLSKCDFVLDVGETCSIADSQVRLDHHKDVELYENGIKKAACGKLAEYLYSDDKRTLEDMRNRFLYALEAVDNGQKPEDFGFKPSIFEFVTSLNVTWNEDMSLNDENFKKAVEVALPVFKKEIEHIKAQNLAKDELDKAFTQYDKDNRILCLDTYVPWEDYVIDKNNEGANIAAICYKGSDGDYCVWSIPPAKGEFSPARLPKEWRGLRNEELQKVSGIKSAVFCFGPGCFFICKDKKDILHAAYEMVQEQIKAENQERQTDIR